MKKLLILTLVVAFSSPVYSKDRGLLSANDDGSPANVALCALGVLTQGMSPKKIFEMKGCMKSIKNACKWEWDNGNPFMVAKQGASKAHCLVFGPLLL